MHLGPKLGAPSESIKAANSLIFKFVWKKKQVSYILRIYLKYELNYNFLTYMKVVSAIPKRQANKARQKQIDKRTFLADTSPYLSPNVTITLPEMKKKDYYWLLINKDNHELKPRIRRAQEIQLSGFQLDTFSVVLKNVCNENKRKEFCLVLKRTRSVHFVKTP